MKTIFVSYILNLLFIQVVSANKFLRISDNSVSNSPPASREQHRSSYLRIDAKPRIPSNNNKQGWDEEEKKEVMMELNQMGKFAEEYDEDGDDIMDIFELEELNFGDDEFSSEEEKRQHFLSQE